MHWLNRDTERMEHVLLVGGRLWVGDVLSEFLLLTFLPAQQFFPPLSFCLCLFFFCRHWSHQCWGLNCSHSTQLNHLVCNGGSALYPLLWGMGAWPVYGSFQLTGLGVCLLGCQVKLESLKGFALRHSHPTFYRKNSPFFYNRSLFFVVFPFMPISDNVAHWCHCRFFTQGHCQKQLHNRTVSIVVAHKLQTTIKVKPLIWK